MPMVLVPIVTPNDLTILDKIVIFGRKIQEKSSDYYVVIALA